MGMGRRMVSAAINAVAIALRHIAGAIMNAVATTLNILPAPL